MTKQLVALALAAAFGIAHAAAVKPAAEVKPATEVKPAATAPATTVGGWCRGAWSGSGRAAVGHPAGRVEGHDAWARAACRRFRKNRTATATRVSTTSPAMIRSTRLAFLATDSQLAPIW